MEIHFEQDAYNAVGERLTNDAKQARRMMGVMILAALASIAFLLWMVLWQPAS